MVKQTIQIFARIKPSPKSKIGLYELNGEDDGSAIINFSVPRDLSDGFINNKKENHKFKFGKVFDQKTKQDEIFETVAKPVIDNVLEGYNGTLFAYGQTGSGKTFTITGGAERYVDRGIIPRSLSYIFQNFQEQSEFEYSMQISYLEIYNENGYDLLDPKHEVAKLEDLPKVSLMEDSEQNIHLKNLSVHTSASEEDALNLLFMGDTNRMIAETPMNQASTRSHCIFTIHLMSKVAGSATVRRAKLHLVDLAGSERVSKTGTNGILLTEAKYINLSLHYLEQVIISLSEKHRSHIPYRNSMMTSVLRDSLGGNCMTTMIATVSIDKNNIDESISTCRFSQRVAMIRNDAILNEELDPKLMIEKLKREIVQLKEELAMATGEQRSDELTEEEKISCEEEVKAYCSDTDPDCILNLGADMRKIQFSYTLFKQLLKEKPVSPTKKTSDEPARMSPVDTGPYMKADLKQLKQLIEQRDNEINILVGMLKKEKTHSENARKLIQKHGLSCDRPVTSHEPRLFNGHSSDHAGKESHLMSLRPVSDSKLTYEQPDGDQKQMSEAEQQRKTAILGDMSLGRQEAFEIFRRDYSQNDVIEENKRLLKVKFGEAKNLGERVNNARVTINQIKGFIEQHRLSLVMQGLVDPSNNVPDETENSLRQKIDMEKVGYKESYDKLKEMKTEIEHIQHFLERSKVKILKDFELWWAEQVTLAQERKAEISLQNGGDKKRPAWKASSDREPKSQPTKMSSLRVMSDHMYSQHPTHPSNTAIPPISQSYYNNYTHQAHQPSRETVGDIPLTGDTQADADIMAFVKARQKILKHNNAM